MSRTRFLDNIRVLLTALVVLHHVAGIYGAKGTVWRVYDVPDPASPTVFLLSLFNNVNQTYFMGFFFLIAGYFTPPSYDKKGPRRFLIDRLLRLGIPLAAYLFFIGPATNALVERLLDGRSFRGSFIGQWRSLSFHPGPLWFAEALLIFSVAYVLWRVATAQKTNGPTPTTEPPLPNNRTLLL